LTLSFPKQVVPNGNNRAQVYYAEEKDRDDLYDTVSIPGPKDKDYLIAQMKVEVVREKKL
jgi:hypothetical protein